MTSHQEEGRRWVISGRVQGVGFRWFTLRCAERIGAVGWARNLPDGSVEVVARATRAEIAELDAALRRGPTLARVDNVETTDIPHEQIDLNYFEIN